jgi:hypothetical protein
VCAPTSQLQVTRLRNFEICFGSSECISDAAALGFEHIVDLMPSCVLCIGGGITVSVGSVYDARLGKTTWLALIGQLRTHRGSEYPPDKGHYATAGFVQTARVANCKARR